MTQAKPTQMPVPGNSDKPLSFDRIELLRKITIQMATQARRRMAIFSLDLDAAIFDQAAFLEAVKRLALSSQHARIEILLQDHDKVIKQGHGLVELARRLSSTIELRRPNPDYLQHPENFMLVDRSGLIHRKLATIYQGVANFHAPLETRRLFEFFREVWESSEPDHELRRLYL